jgi:hypothetical protein
MKPLPAGYPPTSEPDFTPLRLLANPPDRVNCLRLHRQRREAGRYVDGVVDRLMDQTGHTDPGFTLRVYRHSVRRDQESKDVPSSAWMVRALTAFRAQTRAQTGKTRVSLAWS